MELEGRVLNWKDEEGNTILHVSSRENNIQVNVSQTRIRYL